MLSIRKATGVAAASIFIVLATAGCHISSHEKDGKEDVDIRTPLGGLAVKTDPAAVLGKVGLPAYPGATRVTEKGSDKDAADVNLSFGSFRLRVLALEFHTNDDRSRVEAFYRKALQQYSDVIACHDEQPVGQPNRTGMGLTCKGDRHVHANLDSDSGSETSSSAELTLKAGSPSRQHLVSMHSEGNGTRFGLVALDLPDDVHSKD